MTGPRPEGRRPGHAVIVGDFATVNGGQAKVAIDSARLLADAGVAVTFFAACGPVAQALDHPGITVVCLGARTILDDPNRLRAMTTGLWNRAAARALRSVLARTDPADTVVHVHGYAKALSPAIGPVLARSGRATVFTMHEYFLACPNGGFFDYQRQEICHRKPLGASCLTTHCDARHPAHKAWRVARGMLAAGPGRLPRALTDVITISETQARVMAPWLPRGARLHRVDNPVPLPDMSAPLDGAATPDRAATPDTTAKPDGRALLFVGRLAPEKGPVLLAEAAARAGLPVRFVGDGPEEAAIRTANPQAEFTGWLSTDAVAAEMARARALVFPSLWYEGQPLAPIEALLRGIPVVCGHWTAAAEEIVDGVNGVICARPDAASLADALARLPKVGSFRSSALAERVAPGAHRERLLQLYTDMLARHAAERGAAAA